MDDGVFIMESTLYNKEEVAAMTTKRFYDFAKIFAMATYFTFS